MGDVTGERRRGRRRSSANLTLPLLVGRRARRRRGRAGAATPVSIAVRRPRARRRRGRAACAPLGFVERERRELDGWAALVLERRVIRLAVRVEREHAELVLAELMAFAPGGLEERDVGRARSSTCSTAPRASCPTLGDVRAAAGGRAGRRLDQRAAGRLGEDWRTLPRADRRRPGLRVRPPWEPPRDGRAGRRHRPRPGVRHRLARHDPAARSSCSRELEPAGALADWGCGSGVLAIAAAKLGWAPVLACDVEPESVDGDREGARRQRRGASRSRAATCARAARPRRPCSRTSSARCCSRSPRT